MPRNQAGVYSRPSGTRAVPNQTISSQNNNAVIDDLEADANAARPVSAGGTGADTAERARSNLGLGNAATRGDNTFTDTQTAPRSRLTSVEQATLESEQHASQIGPTDGANLVADGSGIQARNNGEASALELNREGGIVTTGGDLGVTGDVVSARVVTGDTSANRLALNSSESATLTSTEHPSQTGPTDGVNIVSDNEKLQARNNGVASSYDLNPEGGEVRANGRAVVLAPQSTTSRSNTVYEVGETIVVNEIPEDDNRDRNASATPRVAGNEVFGVGGSGTILAGDWRYRGIVSITEALLVRVG